MFLYRNAKGYLCFHAPTTANNALNSDVRICRLALLLHAG